MNRKKIFAVIITVAAVINSTACQSKEEKYHIKTKDAAYYDMKMVCFTPYRTHPERRLVSWIMKP